MSLKRRKPPHLPFLDGPASFVPGLKPITPADWLSPDTEVREWLNDKRLLIKMMRDKVSAGDINGAAAEELLPLVMKATDETPNQKMPTALEEAASMVTDDLCILEEEGRGDWRLTAGVLCAPTFWTLPERIGLDLGGLHGPVPGGDPELASRIGRIFTGLKPGAILERFNWTVQASDKRYTPERPSADGKSVSDLYLRVERQTIRKLERTGAVVFTIRICVDPLVPILREPHVREAFEDAWLGASAAVRRYKAWDELEGLVAIACREADQAAY
ncbi:MAG: DUF3445 domain-containing protein [Henriciella sp.]